MIFGIPQGSILGPIIFNLYVSDLKGQLQCQCFQYADDTTLLLHTKVRNLHKAAAEMNNVIEDLESYSSDSNLSLNKAKTKWMLVSSAQMSRVHSLANSPISLNCECTELERLESTKLLGVHLDTNLSWNKHITSTLFFL